MWESRLHLAKKSTEIELAARSAILMDAEPARRSPMDAEPARRSLMDAEWRRANRPNHLLRFVADWPKQESGGAVGSPCSFIFLSFPQGKALRGCCKDQRSLHIIPSCELLYRQVIPGVRCKPFFDVDQLSEASKSTALKTVWRCLKPQNVTVDFPHAFIRDHTPMCPRFLKTCSHCISHDLTSIGEFAIDLICRLVIYCDSPDIGDIDMTKPL